MGQVELALRLRHYPGMRRVCTELLALYGLDIPRGVKIGSDLTLAHRAMGTVIGSSTIIGDRVTIYQGVTIGHKSAFRAEHCGPLVISDDAVLCAGAVVLGDAGGRFVGPGSVVGANSVLLQDTGPWEVWAGIPATKVGERDLSEVAPSERARSALGCRSWRRGARC